SPRGASGAFSPRSERSRETVTSGIRDRANSVTRSAAANSVAATIEEGVRLQRLTTVGIGGPAFAVARPQTIAELQAALCWARERTLPVVPIGLGSNLLASDSGVDALVVRL